jgi:hypothetical protein
MIKIKTQRQKKQFFNYLEIKKNRGGAGFVVAPTFE